MAEHDVTEAMVEAALAAYHSNQNARIDAYEIRCMRAGITAALAARTTPQRTDASAASVVHRIMRWNIERDGDDILVCNGEHDKSEACNYVRYSPNPTGAGADADWVLVPREPTAKMIAGAAIAIWPAASDADFQMAREAAMIVLMEGTYQLAPGTSLDTIAAGIATMAAAYRAMLAASSPQQRAPHPPSVRESAGEGE